VSDAADLAIRPYRAADRDAVVALWRRCDLIVPWNDPESDIDRKLRVQPELFLVGTVVERVVTTAMAGYEGHRGWINYLAVSPEFQRRGFGRLMMERAEHELRRRGCPKINLQVRASNHQVIDFYRRIGFSVEDLVSMGKRL
jgi:ribosomal protein S18 acetylase RimI-like enzyme